MREEVGERVAGKVTGGVSNAEDGQCMREICGYYHTRVQSRNEYAQTAQNKYTDACMRLSVQCAPRESEEVFAQKESLKEIVLSNS